MNELQKQKVIDYVYQKADDAGYMAMDTAASSTFQSQLEQDPLLHAMAGEQVTRKYIKDSILNKYSKDRRYITSEDIFSVLSGLSEDALSGTKNDLQNGVFEISFNGEVARCTSVSIDQWETALKRFGSLNFGEKRFVFLTCGGVSIPSGVVDGVKGRLQSYGIDVFVVRPNQDPVPVTSFFKNQNKNNLITELDFSKFVEKFSDSTRKSKIYFSGALFTRFASALITKRFCILTGLAGSGKTKLAEAFAMWLCASDQQYRIVAVGADWTGNENLLGYADALQAGQYRAPVNGALELMLRAAADPAQPYFLILDEMNLSHVERYFADFLAAMESANAQLALHGEAGSLALGDGAGALGVPAKLALPENLFIVGTVNVDETTYMFSPKVLDRANVLEFRASVQEMGAFLDDPAGLDMEALQGQGKAFAAGFVQRAAADADLASLVDDSGKALGPQLKDDLLALFEALSAVGAEFGFRTAKEIARFMVIHRELSGPGWVYRDALDAQVLQKLMPKLHGSARKLAEVLDKLQAFATDKQLPLTLEKLQRMQQRLERDGFTSFAEA